MVTGITVSSAVYAFNGRMKYCIHSDDTFLSRLLMVANKTDLMSLKAKILQFFMEFFCFCN